MRVCCICVRIIHCYGIYEFGTQLSKDEHAQNGTWTNRNFERIFGLFKHKNNVFGLCQSFVSLTYEYAYLYAILAPIPDI